MKAERKLRLVSGGGGKPPEPDLTNADSDEPPFTSEELAAASAMRDALDAGSDPLALALEAAHAPKPLAPEDLDALVSRALGDESATTATERAAAERLRAQLDGGGEVAAANGEMVVALRSAVHPAALDPARNEALIEVALRAPLRRRGATVRRIAPVTMAALASIAAMAAGVALFVDHGPVRSGGQATAAFLRARSADDLFDAATPFPRRGEESARVDRIASARASDLRKNRFAAWGVK